MAGLVCFYSALSAGTMGVVAPIAALGMAPTDRLVDGEVEWVRELPATA